MQGGGLLRQAVAVKNGASVTRTKVKSLIVHLEREIIDPDWSNSGKLFRYAELSSQCSFENYILIILFYSSFLFPIHCFI